MTRGRKDIGNVLIRDWCEHDLRALHEINQASVPGVGSLTAETFSRHVRELGAPTLVAEAHGIPVGFVLCMLEGRDYTSLNYQWLSERYQTFAYVDRIAVAPDWRGHQVGEALYRATVERFHGVRNVLLAEVNLEPPNPGSLRFHKRHGFHSVGERWENGRSKGVVYLERKL